jgi:hypothetical protein
VDISVFRAIPRLKEVKVIMVEYLKRMEELVLVMVFTEHASGDGINYGVYGSAYGLGSNYGVYGSAYGPGNFAGYFQGNAVATGDLSVGNEVYSFSLKVAEFSSFGGTSRYKDRNL